MLFLFSRPHQQHNHTYHFHDEFRRRSYSTQIRSLILKAVNLCRASGATGPPVHAAQLDGSTVNELQTPSKWLVVKKSGIINSEKTNIQISVPDFWTGFLNHCSLTLKKASQFVDFFLLKIDGNPRKIPHTTVIISNVFWQCSNSWSRLLQAFKKPDFFRSECPFFSPSASFECQFWTTLPYRNNIQLEPLFHC